MPFLKWLYGLVQNNPVGLASFTRLSLMFAVGRGLKWTLDDVMAFMAAMEAFFALFQYKTVTPNQQVEMKVQKEVLHREANGTGSTGDMPNGN